MADSISHLALTSLFVSKQLCRPLFGAPIIRFERQRTAEFRWAIDRSDYDRATLVLDKLDSARCVYVALIAKPLEDCRLPLACDGHSGSLVQVGQMPDV